MTTTDDIIVFINAALNRDKQFAREVAALRANWRTAGGWPENGSTQVVGDDGYLIVDDGTDWASEIVNHIARHDPARVLRQVAAIRKLVADLEAQEHWLDDRYWIGCQAVTDNPACDPNRPTLPTGRPCTCGRDEDVARRLRIIASVWSDSST